MSHRGMIAEESSERQEEVRNGKIKRLVGRAVEYVIFVLQRNINGMDVARGEEAIEKTTQTHIKEIWCNGRSS